MFADSLFFIALGIMCVLIYFEKIKLLRNEKVNNLLVGKKLRIVFLIFGVLLVLCGIFDAFLMRL